MNYLLYGSESYLLKEQLQKIIHEEGGMDSLNTTFYDANSNQFSINQVIDDANTLPFFSDKKVIIIQNAVFLSGQNSLDEKSQKILEQYLNHSSITASLIFCLESDQLDSRKKVTKLLQKQCRTFQFKGMTEQDHWLIIRQDINRHKLNITEDGLKELQIRIPDTIQLWKNELEKLKLYDGILTAEVIRTLVTRPTEEDVFSLVNTVLKKDLKGSLKIWRDLAITNKDPIPLVLLFASQFRVMYQCQTLYMAGNGQQAIVDELGIHPFRVKKALESSRNTDLNRILELLNKLAELDQQFKSGSLDKQVGFELFLIEATR